MTKHILLTGGLGYIGSHIAVELLNSSDSYHVIIIDNLSNCSIDKIEKIRENKTDTNENPLFFYSVDLLKKEELEEIFKLHKIDLVIHLAGLKSVGESVREPLYYYQTNLISTMNLIEIMRKYNCKNIIFSSSATVYGDFTSVPYCEDMPTGMNLTNPYGKTKHMQEEIWRDIYNSDPEWNVVLLRYFNPISHIHHSLKENPNGIPNNLFPYMVKVYNGEIEQLRIFGKDYDTPDGTCIRDFIHVVDLARGHVKACEYIFSSVGILRTYNLGTGKGVSIQELLDTFEKVNETKLNYIYSDRRPGDLMISYADSSKAEKDLGWKAEYNIEHMVKLE